MDGFTPTLERAQPDASSPDTSSPAARTWAIAPTESRLHAWWGRLRPWGPFLAFVLAPTLVTALYVGVFEANQFQSEAHFIVRTNAPNAAPPSGLGALLGLGAGGGQSEVRSVEDYLASHDAVAALQRRVDLVALFRRPEADVVSRLGGGPAPPPETLLKYYRRHVKVVVSTDSGIAKLTVRAFRPDDAHRIAETLLELGEARVNTFNQRALENGLSVAKAELREAELGVAHSENSVTGFRQGEQDIDPERSSAAQITLATQLEQRLHESKAQLASMNGVVAADSPQRVALASQVQAMGAQVESVKAHLAGPHTAMAPGLGAYESLRLRQEFAAKHYEAAAGTLEMARTEALKQQLFVVRVVEANLPVKALYPERLKAIATVFLATLLIYGIGWLILAGVREHAS